MWINNIVAQDRTRDPTAYRRRRNIVLKMLQVRSVELVRMLYIEACISVTK
jgi:hypothetical protein